MTIAEFKQELKLNHIAHLFVFAGEEDYLKRHYLNELRKTILTDDTLAAFNHIVYKGETVDFNSLKEAISTPPMMADYKLIEWHLANFNAMSEEEVAELASLSNECHEIGWCTIVFYVENSHFDLGNFPKHPSKRCREIESATSLVIFQRSTDVQLSAWIERHFLHEGISTSPDVCRAIIMRVGHSMDTLSNEIEKLVCSLKAKERTVLSLCDLDGVISPTEEDDAFGLSNALLSRDATAAYKQLQEMKRRRVDPLIALGTISRLYSEMVAICRLRDEGVPPAEMKRILGIHEYPLSLRLRALQNKEATEPAKVLSACRSLDASAKSGGIDIYVGLERLIAEFIFKKKV